MGAMLDVELPARPQLRGIVEAVAAADVAKSPMRLAEEAIKRQRYAIETIHWPVSESRSEVPSPNCAAAGPRYWQFAGRSLGRRREPREPGGAQPRPGGEGCSSPGFSSIAPYAAFAVTLIRRWWQHDRGLRPVLAVGSRIGG